jgi:transcriptional regulator with XRE-family HTH domain
MNCLIAIRTEIRRRLGAKVRARRAAAGLNLKHAAERAEIHWGQWRRLEAGELNLTLATLVRVAEALDLVPRRARPER